MSGSFTLLAWRPGKPRAASLCDTDNAVLVLAVAESSEIPGYVARLANLTADTLVCLVVQLAVMLRMTVFLS